IIGRIAAHLMTLRSMSISVAGMLQAGLSPKVESSLVKDLGTNFDREIPEIARLMFATELSTDASGCFEKALADAMLIAPTWTIQGGSKEILRTVISKGIGL
ncbi:MAG: acyl-CoA dehydrogenase family protein, partial [Candidatus Hydrogenedentes bacterium]|nr:acyl-CoA dehydrogenase family protein [Candidatus Hydrogenedentota bacterium]